MSKDEYTAKLLNKISELENRYEQLKKTKASSQRDEEMTELNYLINGLSIAFDYAKELE